MVKPTISPYGNHASPVIHAGGTGDVNSCGSATFDRLDPNSRLLNIFLHPIKLTAPQVI
jgi:hypothetical protein